MKIINKRFVSAPLLCAIVFSFFLSSCGDSNSNHKNPESVSFLNIGTAAITGLYYPTGGLICKVLNSNTQNKDVKCSVQATTGSIYNINSMRKGYMDVGIVQYDWLYNAYFGKSSFQKFGAMQELRSLLNLHQEAFTVVVRGNSDMHTFNDIQGHKVNIGAPGTGILGTMMSVLEVKGWDKDTAFLLASDLKSSEEAEALCDHKIDVMTDTIGHPNGALQEASSACRLDNSIRILPLTQETIGNIVKRFPYYISTTIPCSVYQITPADNKCEDIPTIGIQAMLATTSALDDHVAYTLVKSVFENISSLQSMHHLFANLTPESMVPNKPDIPIHPGALKYFKEQGLL